MHRTAVQFVVVLMGACCTVRAHDVISTKVTWSREISRLVYKRCIGCHHEGGSAFSLMTYQEARPWAKAIKEETLERRMPPWGAVKGFGSFLNDQGLTQEDLELIAGWVEGGAPEGDPALLPKTPSPGAPPAAMPKTAGELLVDGELTLKAPATFAAIRSKSLAEGKSVQVIAELPDGPVDALLWLYDYKPQFDRTYYFAKPLSLPAGTRILCWPAKAGVMALLKSKTDSTETGYKPRGDTGLQAP